jgi:hypothetical protein
MRTRILAGLAVAVALALGPVGPARGQVAAESRPADAELASEPGFPWLCFATSVAALGGLSAAVVRRMRAAGAGRAGGGGRHAPTWYCRRCRRDAGGPECPRCGAPNPFVREPAAATADPVRRARAGPLDGSYRPAAEGDS